MICHLSLAIAIFNLGLILYVIRRAEERKARTDAADRLLDTILKKRPDHEPRQIRTE